MAQFAKVGGGLFGAANVGARDDFHQTDASTVEIDERHIRVHVVDRFARVLFHMDALDPHEPRGAVANLDQHFAFAHDGFIKLADLIALRQVGVEVVLAVEGGLQVDLGLEAQPGAHGLFDAIFVDHRQHAGHRGIDEGHVAVGLRAEFGRGAGEELRVRRDLRVHLHPDDQFPVMFGTGNHARFRGVVTQIKHRGRLRSIGTWPVILERTTRFKRQASPAWQSGGGLR